MSFLNEFLGYFFPSKEVTILNTQTESGAIDTVGMALCGILLPAAFTGTAITFLVSDALGGTYVPLHSTISGTLLTYTVVAGKFYAIDPKDFQGVRFLKIKSGSAEGADRTVKLALKGI